MIRERDDLRARLESAQPAAAPAAAAAGVDANGKRAAEGAAGAEPEGAGKKAKPALSAAVSEAMTACSAELSKGRKKRAVSPTLATPEDLAAFSLRNSFPVHSTRKGGIAAVAVAPDADAVVATAGGDATVQLFDRAAGRALASLKGHSKKVLDVKFVGSVGLVASASADKTVRVWKAAGGKDDEEAPGYECAAVLEGHGGEVVSVCVHPTNDYLVTASSDGAWGLYDIGTADCLARVSPEAGAAGFSAAALHPDGLILCTGAEDAGVQVGGIGQMNYFFIGCFEMVLVSGR